MALDTELIDINWSEPFEIASPTTEEAIPAEYTKCLQNSFGHSHFRAMQWKVISSILHDARDNCVIMATGYGKSLCFQFPSVYRNTITIVVSPLISLMQDQVLAMRISNLRACFLGSAQTKRETVYEVIERQYNIVYVTPEYIVSESGIFLLERIREHLTLIAIDEAHCISKWGHDFRSAYRHLSQLRVLCPSVPILAMTATATAQVRDDIIASLELRNAQIVATGFDRPNLEFIIKRKTEVWSDISSVIKNIKIGSVIVYCISRRITEEVATLLSAHGFTCGCYHAGRSLKQRQQTHDDFIRDRIRVVVATIAFGMGINKPDVRLVIHYGVSKDVESYYQEVGRAGRDGLPAKCIMFHSQKDWQLHRIIREGSTNTSCKEQMETLMLAMRKYIDHTQCRRRFILSYFGEDCSKLVTRRDCCDNCARAKCSSNPQETNMSLFDKYHGLQEDGLLDITDETFKILSLLRDMGGRYGLRKALLVLRGSKSQLLPVAYANHSLFGSLKDKSEKWLQAVINGLMHIEMLAMIQMAPYNRFGQQFGLSACSLTSKAKVWLSGIIKRDPIKIVPGEEIIRLLKPKVVGTPKILQFSFDKSSQIRPSTSVAVTPSAEPPIPPSSSTASSDIYRPLLKVRSKLASLFDVMPYLVASTRALQQLAKIQPTTMEELRNIRLDGYSEEKTQRFGPVFLKVIKEHRNKNSATKQPLIDEMIPVKIKSEANVQLDTTANDTNPDTNANINDNDSQSTQNSIELIEPPPPPLIEIDSEIEDAIFADWDSDVDDTEWPGIDVKEEQSSTGKEHSPGYSGNTQLDLLIDALESEDLSQKATNANDKRMIRKAAANDLEYENDDTESESDIFGGEWDLDIDEADLTQVSEKAEQQFKCETTTSSTIIHEPTKVEIKSELVPPALDSNQNLRKPRIIERKTSEAFEYEDDSESEVEEPSNAIVSPKKRALPSWMQLTGKKKR